MRQKVRNSTDGAIAENEERRGINCREIVQNESKVIKRTSEMAEGASVASKVL